METLITALIWAAVVQGLLLGFVFIGSKKRKSRSNNMLGFFLIAFIFNAISDLIPYNSIGAYDITHVFSTPEVKLFLPLLFLNYVLNKIGRQRRYTQFLKVNYILAFTIVSITLFNLLLLPFNQSVYGLFSSGKIEGLFMIQQYYAYLVTIFAFVVCVIETLKYRIIAKNEFTDSTMLAISWLWQFILIMLPVIILWGAELVRIIFGGKGQSDIVLVIWALITVFIYVVSYKAFTRPDLFEVSLHTINWEKPSKRENTSLKESDNDSICEQLKIQMKENQYYLDQNLTIHQLAKEVSMSSRVISTCINKSFGLNFNEWVNNYRVEQALNILQDKTNDHLSIEGVGQDSGFKSRSAMYIAFKKKTGHTPGHFRK